jgi:hypothetical protein
MLAHFGTATVAVVTTTCLFMVFVSMTHPVRAGRDRCLLPSTHVVHRHRRATPPPTCNPSHNYRSFNCRGSHSNRRRTGRNCKMLRPLCDLEPAFEECCFFCTPDCVPSAERETRTVSTPCAHRLHVPRRTHTSAQLRSTLHRSS